LSSNLFTNSLNYLGKQVLHQFEPIFLIFTSIY
jgi:hypothetical protein